MIQPAKYDFVMQRGTFGSKGAVIVQFLDDTGAPSSLAGAQFVLQAQYGAYFVSKRTSDASMSFDETSSTLTWLPTQGEVASCPPGALTPYYLDIFFPDGSGLRLLEGMFVGKGV